MVFHCFFDLIGTDFFVSMKTNSEIFNKRNTFALLKQIGTELGVQFIARIAVCGENLFFGSNFDIDFG